MANCATFVMYYVAGRQVKVVCDKLYNLADAQLFADYLAIYSNGPRRILIVATWTKGTSARTGD